MEQKIKILGILIKDRIKEAGKLQIVLSNNSKAIQSRIGYHELNENTCSRVAIIVITLKGDENDQNKLISEINKIGGIELKDITFEL